MLSTQLPNVESGILTDEQLSYYLENGYYIHENLLSDEECEQLIKASANLENAKNGTYTPQMMPHRQNELFLHDMKKPAMIQILNQLLSGTAAGLQTEFFFCKPGTRGFSLHQDNFFVQAPYGAFASAWVALTDTYLEKGGLIVYPGSHKEGQLPVRKLQLEKDTSQDPNANNEETIVPDQYRPINAVVPKGAALFIHGHVVHGSNPNTTNEWRQVLLNTFIRKGEPFRPGNYAQREEITL
ncbi:MAG TPA: phytanoyl-CoA dioxygenase family protein [Gammaproteobacteria bacterium]|nr:phytanoyl-CoA dioxygenase family protein [Gammaproteobacteria bacterium]